MGKIHFMLNWSANWNIKYMIFYAIHILNNHIPGGGNNFNFTCKNDRSHSVTWIAAPSILNFSFWLNNKKIYDNVDLFQPISNHFYSFPSIFTIFKWQIWISACHLSYKICRLRTTTIVVRERQHFHMTGTNRFWVALSL